MKKNLYLNSAISLIYQICAVIIGLILPRLILQSFGSEVNGLVTSITQLLSIISLLDFGVGAVVQSALYVPLKDNDIKSISNIYSKAQSFFTLIAKALLIYIIILCLYYGIFKNNMFSWVFTTTLILSISISFFAQYFFGICNTLLLNADQKVYVVTLVNLVGLFANATAIIIMLRLGASVQAVKLVSSIVFLIKPIVLELYVRKHYIIKKVVKPPKDSIPNQWSGLAQHIAVVITNSVDNVLLTIFSTFTAISIYQIYVMPLNSIRTLFEVTSTSYKSFFGNIIAKDETNKLSIEFEEYETAMHYITIIIMTTTIVTLIPFVLIYTAGINDANYNNKLFCISITFAYTIFILRLPYTNLIFAAGKFKETQLYSILECVINIVVSVSLVIPFGLIGVAIGTLLSSGYRMVASVYYLKRDIIKRKYRPFIKHILVDTICFGISMIIFSFVNVEIYSFLEWTVFAAISFIVCGTITTVIHLFFYHKEVVCFINRLVKREKT